MAAQMLALTTVSGSKTRKRYMRFSILARLLWGRTEGSRWAEWRLARLPAG